MSRLLWILLVVEAALVFCASKGALAGDAVVLLLAANSALLIWSFRRWRRPGVSGKPKPSCCR